LLEATKQYYSVYTKNGTLKTTNRTVEERNETTQKLFEVSFP
jgi:hypothetical protein